MKGTLNTLAVVRWSVWARSAQPTSPPGIRGTAT